MWAALRSPQCTRLRTRLCTVWTVLCCALLLIGWNVAGCVARLAHHQLVGVVGQESLHQVLEIDVNGLGALLDQRIDFDQAECVQGGVDELLFAQRPIVPVGKLIGLVQWLAEADVHQAGEGAARLHRFVVWKATGKKWP